jgi:hypothetical protein
MPQWAVPLTGTLHIDNIADAILVHAKCNRWPCAAGAVRNDGGSVTPTRPMLVARVARRRVWVNRRGPRRASSAGLARPARVHVLGLGEAHT